MDRIKKYADTGNLIKEFNSSLFALMWIWSKWGSSKAIKSYMDKAFAADSQSAIAFLDSYVGRAYDLMSGRKSRSEFRREAYDEIAKFIDPKVFVKPLTNLYGIDVATGELPLSRLNKEESFERLIARQFLYIHRKVQNKTDTVEE